MEPVAPNAPVLSPPPVRTWFRRWRRRAVVAVLILVAVCLTAALGIHGYLRFTGNRALARETAKLDAEEPGWRLQKLLTARNARLPVAGENSAELVQNAIAAFPAGATEFEPAWRERGLSNRVPRPTEVTTAVAALRPFEPALRVARPLNTRPSGGSLLVSRDIPTRTVDYGRRIELVSQLLRCEAELAALDRRNGTAAERTLAVLNTGRSIGDEPLFVSQVDRSQIGRNASDTLAQVLAWTDLPEPALAQLQSAITAEAREPIVHWVLRGERAVFSEAFDKICAGQIDDRNMPLDGPLSKTPEDYVTIWGGVDGSPYRRAALAGDQAKFLDLMTRLDRLGDLSLSERKVPFNELVEEVRQYRDFTGFLPGRYATTSRYLPFMIHVFQRERYRQGGLSCAFAGIACERFRLKHGRWPRDLAELCPEFLATVPLDPFSGEPLRYRTLDDGVAVHSVGPKPEHQFSLQPRPGLPDDILVGFRLWNPEARRQPPPPEPPAPKVDPLAFPDVEKP